MSKAAVFSSLPLSEGAATGETIQPVEFGASAVMVTFLPGAAIVLHVLFNPDPENLLMRVSFVMLGLKDHKTGGYDFNLKAASALEARGHIVDRVHYTTIPRRFRGGRFAGSFEVLFRAVSFRPDVLVVSRSYTFMIPLRLLLVLWRIPVLYLVHHMEWRDSPGEPCKLRVAMVKWLVRRGNLIWCNSRATFLGLLEMGMEPERLRVIPPGFTPFEVKRTTRREKPLVVCVGALTERKGQETILRACSLLGEIGYEMVLAGSHDEEPEYAERVRGMASSPELSGVVTLSGHLDKPGLYRLLGEADIMVHGAPWEAYGIALAEGMWAGLPVVASRGGAVPELLTHGVEGFLYEPGDAADLAERLSLLLENRDLRDSMGIAARARAEGFHTWEKTCEEFANLVEETACGQVRRNMPRGPGVPAKNR